MRAAGDFLPLLLLALAAALYERRLATLRRKAARVPLNRRLLVWTALVLLAGASAAPLHEAAEELLTFHMVQHVLLGDLAPLALALGLSGPVLRPLLALPAAKPLRVLAHPFVALPLWAGTLVAWHLSPAYDAAVESEALHALEHASFFLAGLAMWMPVAETLPSPAWFTTRAKLVYVVGVRAVGMGLGNVLFWAGSPLYPRYVGREG